MYHKHMYIYIKLTSISLTPDATHACSRRCVFHVRVGFFFFFSFLTLYTSIAITPPIIIAIWLQCSDSCVSASLCTHIYIKVSMYKCIHMYNVYMYQFDTCALQWFYEKAQWAVHAADIYVWIFCIYVFVYKEIVQGKTATFASY